MLFRSGGEPRLYSALIDGHSEFNTQTGRRNPKFRFELPGNPILGDGKSDKQKRAIVFYHGEYLQLIDTNQDVSVQRAFRTTRSCCLPARGMCTRTHYSHLTALPSFPLCCTSQHRPEEPAWSSYLACNMRISSDPLAPRCTQHRACALQLDYLYHPCHCRHINHIPVPICISRRTATRHKPVT